MRLICLICWSFAIFMFCVPEPERNLTNIEEVQEKETKLIEMSEIQSNLSQNDPQNDVSDVFEKMSDFLISLIGKHSCK